MSTKRKTKQKSSKPRDKETFSLAQTEHGAIKDWLLGLREDEFRDSILPEVFKQMKSMGLLRDYRNIHGRNDKGVDYLLFEVSPLTTRVIGVQVKSSEMTRSSGSNSAISVKSACESAMEHEFSFDGLKVRLDQIEVWNSGHTTEDAEAEFRSAGSRFKIPLKTGDTLVQLIEKYAPSVLVAIPQYAVLAYLNSEIERNRMGYSLFGQRIGPHQHFLEPKFTPGSTVGLDSVKANGDSIRPKETKSLKELLSLPGHIVITGNEMSGKSYCLERIFGLLRNNNASVIPVYFEDDETRELKADNLVAAVGQKVCHFSVRQIEALSERNQFVLLLDRIDLASRSLIEHLTQLDPARYRVIGSARSFQGIDVFTTFNISGVTQSSITRFVRRLDVNIGSDSSFTDRALNYVQRALGALGLPATPFVVAACLRECHAGANDLNTPTFGRLVSRFIEDQAGSHNDNMRVDHEAKDIVLKELSSLNVLAMSIEDATAVISDYITRSGSPHTLAAFLGDFEYSRILEKSRDGKLVKWCHPIYLKYYWLRQCLSNGDESAIIGIMKSRPDPTLSALYASHVNKCDGAVVELLNELNQLHIPETIESIDMLGMEGIFLPSEDDHEELLKHIESLTEQESETEGVDAGVGMQRPDQAPLRSVPEQTKERYKRQLEYLISRIHEEKFAIAGNLSAILVNGRGTGVANKIAAVRALFLSNARFGRLISNFVQTLYSDDKNPNPFRITWIALYLELVLIDRSIGDTYLREVFRAMPSHDLCEEERIQLLDLRGCCGAISDEDFIAEVKSIGRLEVTIVLHLRLVLLYYFRFQKPEEKRRLRQLMIGLSKIHKGVSLDRLIPEGK